MPDEGDRKTKIMILGVIFIPPVYFFSRKRWGAFIVNSFFYGCACLCVISFALIFAAPFFWLIAFLHAVWNYKKEMANKRIDYMATKMAEKMSAANQTTTTRT